MDTITDLQKIRIDNRPQYTFIRSVLPEAQRLFDEQTERMLIENKRPSTELAFTVLNKNNTLSATLYVPKKELELMDDRAADVLDYLTNRIIETGIKPNDILEIDLYDMLEKLGFSKNKNSEGRECGYRMRDYVFFYKYVLAFTKISSSVDVKVRKKGQLKKEETKKTKPETAKNFKTDITKIFLFKYAGKIDRVDANYCKKARLEDKTVIRSEENYYTRKMLLEPSKFFFSLITNKQTSQIPLGLLRMHPQKRKPEKRIGKYLLQYQTNLVQTLQIGVIVKAIRLNIAREKEFYKRFLTAIKNLIEAGIIKKFECPAPPEGKHWFSVWLESNAVITF